MDKKKKMSLGKKIGIGIGIVFLLIIILGIIGSVVQQSDSTGISESSEQQLSTEKSALELLPKRADLSTEWQLSSNGTNEIINATGFDSGSLLSLRKRSGSDVTSVTTHIYKFDSIENANNYYQSIVGSQKEEGGYSEDSTFGIGANCYAGHQESLYSERAFVYCTKNNIVLYIRGTTSGFYAIDAAKEVAKVIASKI